MPNNIAVSITADVSDLQVKRAILSAELKAATKDLNDFAKQAAAGGGTDELRAGMLASADAAQKARNSIGLVNAELKELSGTSHKFHEESESGIGGMIGRIHEGAESIRTMQMRAKEFAEVYVAMFAVEQVKEFTEKMGEAAEKTKHLAETFGMTVPEVQGLQSAASMTGIEIDKLAQGLAILDKNAVQAAHGTGPVAQAFHAIGISANDGRTQMERVMVVADKFKDMADGPNKVALAMELFGKSGKDMIPFLNMGSRGIEELDQKTQEYSAGVLIASDANKQLREWLDQVNERGVALAESTNETKVAWQGMSNVLTDALAPVLTEIVGSLNLFIGAMIESYREGGAVAEIFQVVVGIVQTVGETFNAVVEIISAVWDAVSELVDEIVEALGGEAVSGVDLLKETFNVLRDAVVIAKDIIVGCIEVIEMVIQELVGMVRAAGQAIYQAFTGDWGSIQATWDANLNALAQKTAATASKIAKSAAEMRGAVAALMAGAAPPGSGKGGGIPEPKAGGDFNPDLTKGGHHKKGHQTSIAQKLEEELEAKKTAWAMEQDAQGTYQQFSLQSEANFWAEALKRTDLTAKDRLAIEKKFLAARAALLAEKQAQQTEDAKQTEALAREAAKTEVDLARLTLQEKLATIDEEQRAHQITATRALQMKADVNRQIYALDQQLEQQEYAIQLKGLQDELKILGEKPQYYKKINDQIALLEKQHQDRMVLLSRQADDKILADKRRVADQQRQISDQTFRPFAQSLSKMLTGQQTVFATLQQMWQNLQNVAARAIENIITNWLVGLATKESAEKASEAKSIIRDAMKAARGAFNAVVHIPIIGPILAPIAAATAFAAVSAFSAEGGDWDVKEGLYKLHEKEMVLPAHLATPMRSMIANGGASNDNAAGSKGAAAGGDSHLHYSPTIHGSAPKSLDQMLREEGDSMLKWFGGAVRSGQIKVG